MADAFLCIVCQVYVENWVLFRPRKGEGSVEQERERMSEIKVGLIQLADDGTLFIVANVDMAKVGRILLSADGTNYGDMFYPDTDESEG